jgi:hypothetical protein
MKFNKSDLGLYFASSLVGGGVGLLLGALIASLMAGPEPVLILDEEEYDPVQRRFGLGEEAIEAEAEKIARVKKPRKTTTKITGRDDPELAAFIAEWEPSTIQIELVYKGLVTMEDLKELLIKERLAKEAEPYNYNKVYYEAEFGEKPELADLARLPEEEPVVDDRYQILRDPPANKDPKALRIIYWDAEDDSFYTLTRKKQPVPTDLRGVISDETWTVMVPYFDKGYDTLYVDDLESNRFYRFIVVPDDLEDSLGDDHGSDE